MGFLFLSLFPTLWVAPPPPTFRVESYAKFGSQSAKGDYDDDGDDPYKDLDGTQMTYDSVSNPEAFLAKAPPPPAMPAPPAVDDEHSFMRGVMSRQTAERVLLSSGKLAGSFLPRGLPALFRL